ncbi:hypothetical protein HO133_004903 [Letharia lupina]|uniref:Uncharacterized protein n=1 Tax=Letharia lupina TaxID=560253 RepID=A0A8H6F8X6_9LECA|nr:uncharacterized protein HO133_004903 [Letharia lupina]KAF6219078.1 hypothetical protein HO133_004903 [Letharia lupina]
MALKKHTGNALYAPSERTRLPAVTHQVAEEEEIATADAFFGATRGDDAGPDEAAGTDTAPRVARPLQQPAGRRGERGGATSWATATPGATATAPWGGRVRATPAFMQGHKAMFGSFRNSGTVG